MSPIEIAISFVGIAILIGISWALGAMRSIAVDETNARDRLAFDEPDFVPVAWYVGADGKSAAALSEDGGEIALVFAVGDGLATRRFRHGAVSVEKSGTSILFQMREPALRQVRLDATDESVAAQWVLRLAGAQL